MRCEYQRAIFHNGITCVFFHLAGQSETNKSEIFPSLLFKFKSFAKYVNKFVYFFCISEVFINQ